MKRISNWWQVEPFELKRQLYKSYMSKWEFNTNHIIIEIVFDNSHLRVEESFLFTKDDFDLWDTHETPNYIKRINNSKLCAKLNKKAIDLIKNYEKD